MSDKNSSDSNKKRKNEQEDQLLWVLFKVALNIIDPFKIIRNYFLKPVITVGLFGYEKLKEKTEEKWTNTQNILIKVIGALVFCIVIVCAAIMMYAVFYFSYMPSITYVKPLHMQYRRICEHELGSQEICRKNQIDEKTSAFHSFPSSHIELPKKHFLMAGQPYIISVTLDLPDNQKNQDVGMFMICSELKSRQVDARQEKLNAHACRSTMLKYYSPFLQKVTALIYAPLIITGFYEQKQSLTVEMFPSYVDDTTNPVTDIYVEIQSKLIEFYSASIEITAHFTGLRYLMYHYPISSATFAICGNLMFILLLLVLCWYHWDNEMEWVEEARKMYESKKESNQEKLTGFNSKNMLDENGGDSSSITTEKSHMDDENLSILDYHDSDTNTADDDFFMDQEELDKPTIDLLPSKKDEGIFKSNVEE